MKHSRRIITAFTLLISCAVVAVSQQGSSQLALHHVTNFDHENYKYYEQQTDLPSSPVFTPVVVLTYQRCGSTFFGKLFNLDADAFYSYEPLDAYYTSLYGTKPGWNSPSDIVSFGDGSHRSLPAVELTGIAKFLGNLLTCRIDLLPTELLLHPFWSVPAAVDNSSTASRYWRCLNVHRMVDGLQRAQRNIQRHCGRMFRDRSSEEHERCRLLLLDNEYRSRIGDESITRSFNTYRSLLDLKRRQMRSTCLPIFRSMCSPRPLRVAKVVRATMQSMKPLMEWFPDLRVIHLVRDPRAVGLSRRELDSSFRGRFADAGKTPKKLIVREATIYCRQVVADIRWKNELEESFPGRFYSLTYEQLVDNPIREAVDIYQFIGMEAPPTSVIERFDRLAEQGTRNITASTNAFRWRKYVTDDESSDIVRACSDMFDLYPQYRKVRPIENSNGSVTAATHGDGQRITVT